MAKRRVSRSTPVAEPTPRHRLIFEQLESRALMAVVAADPAADDFSWWQPADDFGWADDAWWNDPAANDFGGDGWSAWTFDDSAWWDVGAAANDSFGWDSSDAWGTTDVGGWWDASGVQDGFSGADDLGFSDTGFSDSSSVSDLGPVGDLSFTTDISGSGDAVVLEPCSQDFAESVSPIVVVDAVVDPVVDPVVDAVVIDAGKEVEALPAFEVPTAPHDDPIADDPIIVDDAFPGDTPWQHLPWDDTSSDVTAWEDASWEDTTWNDTLWDDTSWDATAWDDSTWSGDDWDFTWEFTSDSVTEEDFFGGDFWNQVTTDDTGVLDSTGVETSGDEILYVAYSTGATTPIAGPEVEDGRMAVFSQAPFFQAGASVPTPGSAPGRFAAATPNPFAVNARSSRDAAAAAIGRPAGDRLAARVVAFSAAAGTDDPAASAAAAGESPGPTQAAFAGLSASGGLWRRLIRVPG